jgi:hypothetical protein
VNLPVEVIEAVGEGRCLVFVGGRFSAEARVASGLEVVNGRELAKGLGWTRPRVRPGRPAGPVTPSVRDAATQWENEQGRASMAEQVQSLVGAKNTAPTSAHAFIVRNFDMVFTTVWDDLFEQAGKQAGRSFQVVTRGEPLPEPASGAPVLVRMRGGFDSQLCVTREDHDKPLWDDDGRRQMRKLLRKSVVLFVGYRPDEEEFEVLFDELTDAYGANLPRCHLAVAQGRIDDYQWQRWVWRGLLLFTADPEECTEALEAALKPC